MTWIDEGEENARYYRQMSSREKPLSEQESQYLQAEVETFLDTLLPQLQKIWSEFSIRRYDVHDNGARYIDSERVTAFHVPGRSYSLATPYEEYVGRGIPPKKRTKVYGQYVCVEKNLRDDLSEKRCFDIFILPFAAPERTILSARLVIQDKNKNMLFDGEIKPTTSLETLQEHFREAIENTGRLHR